MSVMKKAKNNLTSLLKTAKWISALLLLWSIVCAVLITVGAKDYPNPDDHGCLRLVVSSDQKVEITTNTDGWSVNLYGKTDTGCGGETNSPVTATFKITTTGKKADGSVRSVTFTMTTEKMQSNVTDESVTLDSTNTEWSGTATSGNGAANFTTIEITIPKASIVQEDLGVDVTTTFKPGVGGIIQVDDITVTEEKKITNSDSKKYTLKAVAASGYTFYGWMSSTAGILTKDGVTTYTYPGQNEATIWPVFVKSESALYCIRGATPIVYYSHLDEAIVAAGDSGTVVVCQSGIAYHSQSGSKFDITIPQNITLLIPYDDGHTLCTTTPTHNGVQNGANYSENSYVTPTQYRKLTLAAGANLTVNGAISLSAKQSAKQGTNGSPTGAVSVIDMKSEGAVKSTITVSNGGKLYAWGYIIGSGVVNVKSGGIVYEGFQIRDWRGGTATSGMINNNSQKVFPVSQYYVQNVEVAMKLEAGAYEYAYMGVTASLGITVHADSTVPFVGPVGSGAMFQLSDGYLMKDYLESSDRLQVDIYGGLSMSALNLNVQSAIANYNMNSSEYVLPIGSNLLVNIRRGTATISQDMAFLPGSELVILEEATVSIAEGVSVFVYDEDQWKGKLYVYSKCDVSPLKFVAATWGAPKARPTRDDAKIEVNGTLDASLGYLFTTTGGANICSTGTGKVITTGAYKVDKDGKTIEVTYQYIQSESKFDPIAITPAILQNSAGYNPPTQATSGATTATTYCYDGLKWYIPNATLNDLTVEYRLDDYLWLNAYFTLKDITVTQADVTNKVLTVNNGAELYVTNGKVYLVKKIPADQIPDDQTFIVTYNNGTAQVTAPFSANLTDLRAKTTDEKTKTLIDKLLVYGDAAKLYFGNGKADSQLPLDLTGLPDREKAKDAETVGSGTDKLLSIKGMNVLFEERLSLMVAIQLKKGTTLYDITSLGSGNVAQIGLLVGEKNGGVLTVDNLGTYGKAYILYGNSNKIASDNVPVTENDLPVYQAANKETTDWNNLVDDEGRTVIYLDLKSSAYTSSFELRPFVILKDGTVMYAAQYEYGLGAYIKSILSKENLAVPEGKDANAFRNLLVRTWEYALAAEQCF